MPGDTNMPMYWYDFFNRTASTRTWGTSSSGGVWRYFSGYSTATTTGLTTVPTSSSSYPSILTAANPEGNKATITCPLGSEPVRMDLAGTEATTHAVTAWVSLDFTNSVVCGSAGVVSLASDSGSGYIVAYLNNSLYLKIAKIVNGVEYVLATSASQASTYRGWIKLVVGTSITATFQTTQNTASVITVTAARPNDINTSGRAGVYAKNDTGKASATLLFQAFWTQDLLSQERPAGPSVSDSFVRPGLISDHWGVSSSGHAWIGFTGGRNRLMNADNRMEVSSGLGGYDHVGTARRSSVIGPTTWADYEVFLNVSSASGTSVADMQYRVLARASTPSGTTIDQVCNAGYYVQCNAGGTSIRIGYLTSTGPVELTSAALGFTIPSAGGFYMWISVSGQGTSQVIQGRASLTSTRPTSANVTYSGVTGINVGDRRDTGYGGLETSAATVGTRTIAFSTFTITDNSSSLASTMSSLVVSSSTDTQLTLRAQYTNDSNNNNSLSSNLYYRLPTGLDFNSITISPTRSSGTSPKYWQYTISTGAVFTSGQTYIIYNQLSDTADGIDNGETGIVYQTISFPKNATYTPVLTSQVTGTTAKLTLSYTGDNNNNNTVLLEYRKLNAATWTTISGIKNTSTDPKTYTSATISNLETNTTYEARATITDTDGGSTTTSAITFNTTGRAIGPLSLTFETTPVSVTMIASYEFDTNANSTCAFQYRNINERTWTTVPPINVTTNRTNKQFLVTQSGLKPNMSYEARAIFSDADGVETNYAGTITEVFTTEGVAITEQYRPKSYLYKFYDKEDNYLGTLKEQPEPSFTIQENGGVADLNIKLPRSLSQVQIDPKINFQNRVDIWAISYSSEGMGTNFVTDPEFDGGSWTYYNTGTSSFAAITNLTSPASIDATGGPDDSTALKLVKSTSSATSNNNIKAYSSAITISPTYRGVPFHFSAMAQSLGGTLYFYALAYNEAGDLIDSSITPGGINVGQYTTTTIGESTSTLSYAATSVGTEWQKLAFNYTIPSSAATIKLVFSGDIYAQATYYADKVVMRPLEKMIYRGRIEGYTVRADQDGQSLTIQCLGLSSTLTDDYVRFLQYCYVQPDKDLNGPNRNLNKIPTNPGQMLKDLIDIAQLQNPMFELYYTASSIEAPDSVVEYTFRDQTIRQAMDKIRNLCPPEWHYNIDADGLVSLRNPDNVTTHRLRLNVEISSYENNRTISGLKNVIFVKGRQDEDRSEPDGYGSISYTAISPISIETYGRRVQLLRDANIKDPATAQLVGDARLDELGKPEQRITIHIPDEKDLQYASGALRGYNIEMLQTGDYIQIIDPLADARRVYWDEMIWDQDYWDDTGERVIPESVPIRAITYSGNHVVVELSERPPSAIGDFARLLKWQQLQNAGGGDDTGF